MLINISVLLNAKEVLFNPVASLNARTIDSFKVAITRSPLGNINSHVATSALSIGLFSRFEIGTAPIFYTLDEHSYNFVIKTNFYKGESFDWALVYGRLAFKTEIENENNIKMDSLQLALNSKLPKVGISLGVSAMQSCAQLDKTGASLYFVQHCQFEYGFDLQYEVKEKQWLTIGFGRMRASGFTPFETTIPGMGVVYTWSRPKKFLSLPSLGFYQQKKKGTMLLFSTTFF